MANRSYLYSIDFDRTEKKRTNQKVIGLSETAYRIPISYSILVSKNPKLSNSIIWNYDKPISIQGDYNEGKKRFFEFLDELIKLNLFEKNIL